MVEVLSLGMRWNRDLGMRFLIVVVLILVVRGSTRNQSMVRSQRRGKKTNF